MAETLNLLFVYDTVIDPLKGGVERVTDVLSHEFRRRGHNVMYLILKRPINNKIPNSDITTFLPDKIVDSEENKSFIQNFIKINKINFVLFQNTAFYDNNFPFNCWPIEKCKLINVIHNDPARGIEFFWHLRSHRQSSVIRHLSSFVPRMILGLYHYYNLKRQAYLQYQYTTMHSDWTVILSENFKKNINKYLNSASLKNTSVINNPLSYDIIEDINNKDNVILFVGRLTGNKQCDYVIKAWNIIASSYPDWKLIIAGDGYLRDYCESLAVYRNQTIFKGQCNPESLYIKAKIFCMASSFEGWPMVLTEAMSNGVVPIAFNTFPSVSDVVDDGVNGVLVEPYNIKKYAKAIAQLIDNQHLRESLAMNALKKMQLFTPSHIVANWLNLFHKLP